MKFQTPVHDIVIVGYWVFGYRVEYQYWPRLLSRSISVFSSGYLSCRFKDNSAQSVSAQSVGAFKVQRNNDMERVLLQGQLVQQWAIEW